MYNKNNQFDYIYAGDVAEGLLRMAASVQENTVLNLGYGATHKVEEIAAILKNQFSDVMIRDGGTKDLYEASCAGIDRLKALTGWQPKISLEQGIQRIIDYETNR